MFEEISASRQPRSSRRPLSLRTLEDYTAPPEDSLYYDVAITANICAQMNDKEKVLILGDLNARVGNPAISDRKGQKYISSNIEDTTQNSAGKKLLKVCNEKSLTIANHLVVGDKVFGGKLSYRQGKKWKSEIDLCIIHEDLLPCLYDNFPPKTLSPTTR